MPPSREVSTRTARIWEGVTSHAAREAMDAVRSRRATAPKASPNPSGVVSRVMGTD